MKECSYHHWDLDGVVSKIFHDKIYGKKFSKASGYGKIDKILKEFVSKGFQSITFTDLAIIPEQMEYCVNNFEEVRFFDHHQVSEETYEKYHNHPNVKEAVFTHKLSGAGIMYTEFVKKGGNNDPELAKLAMLGDVYDLWKQDNQYWQEAFDLNDLFWILGFFNFEKRFINGYDGITDKERELIDDYQADIEAALDKSPAEDIDEQSLIIMPTNRGGISHITALIPEYNFYYIILYDERNEQYTLSARTNNVDKLANEPNLHVALSDVAESHHMVMSAGGHKMAGGMTFEKGAKIADVMNIIKTEIHPKMNLELK